MNKCDKTKRKIFVKFIFIPLNLYRLWVIVSRKYKILVI